MNEIRYDIALVGAGRVGTAVALLLKNAGHRIAGVGFSGRRSTRRGAELLGAPEFGVRDMPAAGVVLIGAPEAAIASVARRIAPAVAAGAVVCHFAGVRGIGPLSAVADVGARVCALHPVQACPDVDTAVRRLPGSAWGVTCSSGLEQWCASLVERDLMGRPVFVPELGRAVWHAATVTTANGIAALLSSAEDMLSAIDIDDPIEVLGPLAAGAVANARDGQGGGATLTGPVVRGERETVRLHLDALDTAPELAGAYRVTARVVVDAARRAGRIDATTAREMAALLEIE